MSTRRLLKAAEAVREVVSMAILTQVRDPRVRDVTVTRVEMDPDMRAATVHVSVMGSPAKEELALRGLASSAGFLQAQIADKIETRYTPRLSFKIDGGVKKSIEIARVLREVLPPEPATTRADDGGLTAEPGRHAVGDAAVAEEGRAGGAVDLSQTHGQTQSQAEGRA